jgi:hypothetical protein
MLPAGAADGEQARLAVRERVPPSDSDRPKPGALSRLKRTWLLPSIMAPSDQGMALLKKLVLQGV